MPSILFTRVDLDAVYLPFAQKCLTLAANCQKRGVWYYAVSGYRDPKEQDAKYAIGRTQPGKIITNARGGWSWHNWGLAMDFVRDEDMVRVGLQTSWGNKGYEILKEEGLKLGLRVGVPTVPGGDPGHVQDRNPLTLARCRALGTREAVWAYLTKYP